MSPTDLIPNIVPSSTTRIRQPNKLSSATGVIAGLGNRKYASVPRELAHGNQSFSTNAEISHKACAAMKELVGNELIALRSD